MARRNTSAFPVAVVALLVVSNAAWPWEGKAASDNLRSKGYLEKLNGFSDKADSTR